MGVGVMAGVVKEQQNRLGRTLGRMGARLRLARALAAIAVLLVAGVALVAPPRLVVRAAALNPIQQENSLPGDPTWNDFSSTLSDTALSGYGSQISLNKGQTIDFFVTTTAPSFTIDIYRTGWYQGVGARKILALGSFPGAQQVIPKPDPVTGMIACNWTKTTSLTIPTTWVTGVYLAKLSASDGNKSFIFFVVRNDGGHEAMVLQTSVTTYEAYNVWGGTGLYNNNTDHSIFKGPHATKVSFDRPFSPGDSNGSGHYLFFEYSFVRWAESQGFDITYTTNVDTHTGVNPITNHKAFLSVGHDEYWSRAMRTNVQNAISAGVNVAFFSANTSYWQIRFEPSAAGVPNRVEVGYKDFATDTTPPGPDPQWNVNNAIVTSTWRDPVVGQPENGMLGIMYEDQLSTAAAAYIVQNASNWIYAGTGFVNGTSIPGIVGYEYDRVFNNGATPPGLIVLSNSPVTGQQVGASHANSSIYTAPSGAQVFAAGTIEWSWGLDNYGNRTTANAGIQKTTANILYNFTGTTPPPPPPPLPAGTFVQDGFESGTITGTVTPWTPGGTGQVSVQGTTVNSGAFAVSLTNAAGQFTTIGTSLASGPQASTYTRLYFNLSSVATSATLAQGRDGNNNALWSVSFDAPRKGLDIYFWNGARVRNDLFSQPNILTSANTWYALEVQSNETTTGHGEVWLNGTSVAAVNADLSASAPYGQFQLWNDAASTTIAYDDVKVGNSYNGLVPVSLSPAALTYSQTVQVGTTSAAQTETLTNTGASALAISSVAITGTNATDFAKSADTCAGATLAAGASCAVGVTFSPTAGGARNAVLTFTDNAGNSPQRIALNGIGGAPAVSLSPTSLTFANQNVGTTSAAQAVTLTNSGTWPLAISGITLTGANPGDFGQTNACGASLAAGASCAISVTFGPTATGSRGATLTISDGAAGSPHGVPLAGTSLPAGTYQTDGFESGNLALWSAAGSGQASAQGAVVNTGNYAAKLANTAGQTTLLSTVLAGGGQAQTYTRFYVQVGSGMATSTIAAGRDSANNMLWVIVYDASRQGLDVYFWNGARTRFDLYSNTGLIAPNTWYAIEIQANEATTGHGQIWLNGTSVGTVDGDLSAANPYATLQLWNEVTGTIYFDDVAVRNSFNGLVGAPPPAPAFSPSPASLTFASQTIGTTSAAQTVTVANGGTATLSITGVTVGGANASDFAVTTGTCAGASLSPGATCAVSVTFTPGAAGARSASLAFTDNAAGSPHAVALSGTGAAAPTPAPTPGPGGVYFADDFESGTLSHWAAPAGTGTVAVETSVVHGGTQAVSLTNAAGQFCVLQGQLVGGGQSQTFTSFAFQIANASVTATLAEGRDSSGNPMWAVVYDAGRHGLDTYFWNGARTRFDLYSATNLITSGTWYTLEVQLTETATGHAEVWLNGVSVAAGNGDLSAASPYATLQLWNDGTGTIYFDDVKVSNTF